MKVLVVDNMRKRVPVDGRPFFGVGSTGTFLCVAKPILRDINGCFLTGPCTQCPFRITVWGGTASRCAAYFKCPNTMRIVEAEEDLE